MAQGGHTQTVAGSLVGKRRNLRLGAVQAGAFSGMHRRYRKSCKGARHNPFIQRLSSRFCFNYASPNTHQSEECILIIQLD